MASAAVMAAAEAHARATLAAEIAAGGVIVRALRNLQNPEPPRSEAELGKAHVFLQFPPHTQSAVCIGGPTSPWRERGAIVLFVLVASATQDALALNVFEKLTRAFRPSLIGDLIEPTAIIGADSGPRFGGNWWGVSAAVEYVAEDV